jgi:hypothetical protein
VLGREGRDWGCGNAAEASRRQTSEYSAMNKPRPPRQPAPYRAAATHSRTPPSPFNLEPSWQATHEREQDCARVRRPCRAVNRRMLAAELQATDTDTVPWQRGACGNAPAASLCAWREGGECARANACECGERERKSARRQVNSKIYANTLGKGGQMHGEHGQQRTQANTKPQVRSRAAHPSRTPPLWHPSACCTLA